VAAAEPVAASAPSLAPDPTEAPRKFDLGPTPAVADGTGNIPWGYGQDRVTAMAVDPDRLYVYWEVTDEAIDRARAALGPGGRDAWLNLRVYDVTDRIFDGTNAHDYFDHAVARTDRQWFFSIGRPSSTVVVEIGLKSDEGYFVRVARSGRTDFPRREPAPPRPVEWLTVRSATGEVGEPIRDGRASPAVVSGGAGAGGHHEPAPRGDRQPTPDSQWVVRQEGVVTAREWREWVRDRGTEWEGPIIRTVWEAGPYTYPIEAAAFVEERYEGPVTVHVAEGRVRIVYGPWQVVIRGLGARGERRVLGVWEIHRTWLTGAGVAVRAESRRVRAPGGSEEVIPGASELAWRAASELRLGGASEIYLLGASELRYGGASETFYAGASEWRERGGSERFYAGASELRLGGASELRERGGSELVHRGASERLYPGASEQLYPGASERAWAGASENRPRYPAAPSDG
jgi:hypothetical protein